MTCRLINPTELPAVRAMMASLCPTETNYDFSDETVFVWERETGGLGGFISISIRPWAEGCDSMPVPYVEGWWVAPDLRQIGVGRALMDAAERWCRENNYDELGSDVEMDNEISQRAHVTLGFKPTLRIQFFRKDLRTRGGDSRSEK